MTALLKKTERGVVFKKIDAEYTGGRPASGGTQLKFKLVETASVIVAGINKGKRSVRVKVLDGLSDRQVGNVTIPANRKVPPVGSIIEVRYLYAHRGGSLIQPVYCVQRTDIEFWDCTADRLKYKREAG